MEKIALILNIIDKSQSLILKQIIESRFTKEDEKLSESKYRRKKVIELKKFIKRERIKMMLGFPLVLIFLYLINFSETSTLLLQFQNHLDKSDWFLSFFILSIKFFNFMFYLVFFAYFIILLLILTKKWRLKYRNNLTSTKIQ